MSIVDLTVPITPRMAIWPGDPPVTIEPELEIAAGAEANVSRYCLGSHTGTHVDPPCHFVPGGMSIDQLPLDILVGPAEVVGLEGVAGSIRDADLAAGAIAPDATRILLKTRNSQLWADPEHRFRRDYVSLDLDGARWLIDRGVRLVGIDYLSIEAFDSPGHPVHHLLLSAGVIVVEGLDLRQATPGRHQLVCLPLRMQAGDGGPARVILIDP